MDDRRFGVEFEFIGGSGFYDHFKDSEFSDWGIHQDGSEWEVGTPILKGNNGLKTIKKFLAFLNDFGCRTSLRFDGLHVHHDAPEFINSKANVVRLVESWMVNQDNIMRMVNPVRRGNYACAGWNYDGLQDLRAQEERYFYRGAPYSGRRALNISALAEHGTIEFRLHEGTLNYEEVFSWIRFGQKFIDSVLNNEGPLDVCENPEELLRNIKMTRNSNKFMTQKIRRLAEYEGSVRLR